jgi:hypothetical protein
MHDYEFDYEHPEDESKDCRVRVEFEYHKRHPDDNPNYSEIYIKSVTTEPEGIDISDDEILSHIEYMKSDVIDRTEDEKDIWTCETH